MDENIKNMSGRTLSDLLARSESESSARSIAIADMLRSKEQELEELRKTIQKDQLQKSRDFQREMMEREKYFEARDRELRAREKEMERKYQKQMQEYHEQRVNLESSYLEKYKSALAELETEKERYKAEVKTTIESKATEYVNEALTSLEKSERKFQIIGVSWSVFGGLSIVAGLAAALVLFYLGGIDIIQNKDVAWTIIAFYVGKGAVVFGIIFALAKYSMGFANSYMHESLKNAERRHAINFGKFYLSVFGAGSDWSKLKEVFQHWNISGQSAFSANVESSALDGERSNSESNPDSTRDGKA